MRGRPITHLMARSNYTEPSHGSGDTAARLPRDRTDSPASLSFSPGGSHHRARTGQANRRDQERVAQRAVSVARTRRATRTTADHPHRMYRAGGRDSDPVQAREPRAAAVL